MKFLGKMCLKIISKVTKSKGYTLSLEDTFFKNHRGEVNLTPLGFLGLSNLHHLVVLGNDWNFWLSLFYQAVTLDEK